MQTILLNFIAHRDKAVYLLKKSAVLTRDRSRPKEYNPTFQLLQADENAVVLPDDDQHQLNRPRREPIRVNARNRNEEIKDESNKMN